MEGVVRILAGMAGGFTASASKILALDVERLGSFMTNGSLDEFNELKVTIFVFTPVLMAIGGIVAWASQERNRMKLLAIGCTAPALIAPWTSSNISELEQRASMISSAYAQDVRAKPISDNYAKGVKALLGFESPKNKRYWVIIGSEKNLGQAKAFANAINSEDPTLRAFVGQRQPGNEFYPVIVGGDQSYLPLEKAKILKERAERLDVIPNDAYLSDFESRLPAIQ